MVYPEFHIGYLGLKKPIEESVLVEYFLFFTTKEDVEHIHSSELFVIIFVQILIIFK